MRRLAFTGGQFQWSVPGFYSLHGYIDSVYNHNPLKTFRITTTYDHNGDTVIADLSYQNNIPIINTLTKNNSSVGNLSSTNHQDIAKTVWYVSPDRISIPYSTPVGLQTDMMQPLHPSGNNVTDFLIQQYTSRHPQWDYAESWFKRIDPDMTLLSTPLNGNTVSTVTRRTDGTNEINVNINLQGSGIQNAATIIAAVVFAPDDSTIIIEEPENFLQHSSVEGLIDLFNDIIATTNKQIILITHSWDILTTYVNDLGNGLSRTGPAVITDGNSFMMNTVRRGLPQNKVEPYDIQNKDISAVIDDMNRLLENPAT